MRVHGKPQMEQIDGPDIAGGKFGCFLGTSLLHLRDMVKLLPCEWYDTEVENDGHAKYV